MTKYIELEALKNRFAKRLVWLKKDIHDEYSLGLHDGCEYDTKLIDEIPAADVAPVRHGRWECNKPCPVCGGDRFDGLDADIWADWQPPYCPNCGAKMDMRDTVNNNENKEIG